VPNANGDYANPGWQWGTYAPGTIPGPIVIPVSVPEAQQLVDQGWTLYGQLPAPPLDASPPPAGGPEERGPPTDFDTPPPVTDLPREAPPVQPPAVTQPPVEGEYIPAEPSPPPTSGAPNVLEGEADRFDRYPGRPSIPGSPRLPKGKRVRRIKNVPDRAPPPPPTVPFPGERDIERAILRGIGRVIVGPVGSVLGPILAPEDLGSGELPFPPIPRVEIPPPDVSLPEPSSNFPEPPVPELARPDVPDVVVVTPEPQPQFPAPRSSQTVPGIARNLWPWGLIGAIAAPILRRSRRPRPGLLPANFANLEINPATPLPRARTSDPLTPPAPATGTDPLTPPREVVLPSPAQSGSPQPPRFTSPSDESQCRCQKCKKCKGQKKRRQKLSGKVASVEPFQRRISAYSLKNLRRGGIQRNLKRKK